MYFYALELFVDFYRFVVYNIYNSFTVWRTYEKREKYFNCLYLKPRIFGF